MKRELKSLVAFGLLLGAGVAHADYCLQHPDKCANVGPTYQLDVTNVSPAGTLLEHSPVDVRFSITKNSLNSDEAPERGRVCPVDGSGACFQIPRLTVGQTVQGTLHMKAPAAGAASPLEIEYCRTPKRGEDTGCIPVTSTPRNLAVSARYEVLLQAFEIDHTKARTTDSVWASLMGIAGTAPPDTVTCNALGPPTYCVPLTYQGDRQDGKFAIRKDLRVGPFDLVPEQDADLAFWFVFANWGYSYNEAAYVSTMNMLSGFAGGAFGSVLQAQGGNGNSAAALDAQTQKLNETIAGSCDGIVVNAARLAYNRTRNGQWQSTLDAHTRELGYWVGGDSDDAADLFITTNDTNCGDSAKYKVTWRIARTSWQPAPGQQHPQDAVVLPRVSDEKGAEFCPQHSAVTALQCFGRYCDDIVATCTRYGFDTPRGHRDADAHAWSGWYSEEGTGLPPGVANAGTPPGGFVTAIDCKGDYCDDVEVDTDAADIAVGSDSTWLAPISEETGPAQCPTGMFVSRIQCAGSNCDDLKVECSVPAP